MKASVEVSAGDSTRIRWRTYQLSIALAVIAGVTALLSFFFHGVMHDPPGAIGNMRGTALAMLLLGIPLLVGSMSLTEHGSSRAVFGWLAALVYLVYNAVLFCFMLGFNSFFLLYVAMLSLSVWSLVSLLRDLDVEAIRARATRVPVRVLAGYMLACLALFGYAWLSEIIPASLRNAPPPSFAGTRLLTNPIHVLDLAFTFPLLAVFAVKLWRREGWGYVVAGTSILMLTVETASIALDQVFGNIHDAAQSTAAVPIMIALTCVGAAMSIAFFRGIGPATRRWRLAVAAGADLD